MKQEDKTRFINYVFFVVMAFAIAGFIMKKQTQNVYATIGAYAGYLIFTFFEIKKKFLIENYLRGLVVVTIISHFMLGEYIGLYYSLPHFDKVLHLFGTFAFALFAYSALTKTIGFSCNSKYYTFIIVMMLGISIGVVFEVIEFVADLIYKSQNQSGLVDTNVDLIFNIIGAILAGFFSVYKSKAKEAQVYR